MAEFVALGVAGNIVQFIEIAFNITKSIIETYRSIDPDGLAEHNLDLRSLTISLKDSCTILRSDAKVKADAITMCLVDRCIKIAEELLCEIESLKINTANRQRRWFKFLAAVRAQWRKDKIKDLSRRLKEIKTEIFERVECLLREDRSSLSESMRSLGEASDAWNSATERRLDAMAEDLQKLLDSNAKSEEDLENFGSFATTLSKFADEAKNRKKIEKILTTLNFSQIKARQNEIPEAHQNTFEWIFHESLEVNITKWLHPSSDGVFWVTGKPGSGKSTLMKLISGHHRTRQLAKSWAGPKPLVVASHFFWNAGKPLQKSQEGLLRTLLFQILVQCPEVIPEVCSERYCSDALQAIEPWSVEELSRAFLRIQQIQELPCRVLMLVDGLDEYSGDIKKLTEFLHTVAKSPEVR
ncbi:hypothetical protein K4K59_003897 [Colletotrichum sp. SAR11_240]|nr:hypothetical protein K4K59_003897 [Colletotrichum sp. SAR11_240]